MHALALGTVRKCYHGIACRTVHCDVLGAAAAAGQQMHGSWPQTHPPTYPSCFGCVCCCSCLQHLLRHCLYRGRPSLTGSLNLGEGSGTHLQHTAQHSTFTKQASHSTLRMAASYREPKRQSVQARQPDEKAEPNQHQTPVSEHPTTTAFKQRQCCVLSLTVAMISFWNSGATETVASPLPA